MTRFVCLGLTAVVAGTLAAAPVPKALQKQANYVPLEVGYRWEFSTVDQPDVVTETREVTAVEVKNGVRHVSQKTTNLTQEFRVTDEGVAVVRVNNREYTNPRFIVKAGMKAGDSWEWDADGYTEQRTVGKVEKVTVPAGEFEAIPLTYKMVQNGQSFSSTTVWYADGVGLIRIDNDGQPSQVLKAFTKGGKK